MSRKKVLDLAYDNLRHAFISYAHDNCLDDNEKKRILALFSEVYADKKAEFFFVGKINSIYRIL